MIPGLIARGRSLWRGVRRRADVETEMAEEFRHRLELRAADLVHTGVSPAEARRQARLEFGCAELHKDDAREARGLGVFDGLRVSSRSRPTRSTRRSASSHASSSTASAPRCGGSARRRPEREGR
jgi:hypothetical protein